MSDKNLHELEIPQAVMSDPIGSSRAVLGPGTNEFFHVARDFFTCPPLRKDGMSD